MKEMKHPPGYLDRFHNIDLLLQSLGNSIQAIDVKIRQLDEQKNDLLVLTDIAQTVKEQLDEQE